MSQKIQFKFFCLSTLRMREQEEMARISDLESLVKDLQKEVTEKDR